MKITWEISDIERRVSDNFVQTVHWQVYAVDNDFNTSVYSTCRWHDGWLNGG